jgi:hypothetical protein
VNIVPFPKAFASVEPELGAPKRYFPVRRLYRTGSLVIFFCLLGGSAVVFLNGLSITYQAYQKHGPVMIEDSLTIPGIVALVLFLAGLAAGWWAFKNWSKGVAVYERGFAVHDWKGLRLWRWEEVLSITAAVLHPLGSGISAGMTHTYLLTNYQNQRLILDEATAKVEELARLIQEAIYPALYDQAASQYNAGRELFFGPVIISKGGIQIGNKKVAWAEVQQVLMQQGVLKVSKKEGEWFSGASAPASAIPNLNVLLEIIQQVAGLKIG